MKALNTFIMEDWLESYRFNARYNLGESGGSPRNVKELLLGSCLTEKEAAHIFMNTTLCDSPNHGRNDLRDIVAQFHPGASRENVLITTGTSEALFLLFRYISPKKIALPLPAFQLLYELPQALDATTVPLPIRFSDNGSPFVDEEEWYNILNTEKPDCLLINNPHNPSGLVFEKKFLKNLSEIANKNQCKIIGDEHYRFLSSETEIFGETIFVPNENTFVTGSFIKCFGAPGLRIGWCIGPKSAIDSMQNEKNYITHTVNPITEWISYEVLKNKNTPIFKSMKKEWLENKRILKEFLEKSNTLYGTPPSGGLVTSLGFKNASTLEEATALNKNLIDKGIFVLPLSSMEFGLYHFQHEKEYKEKKLSLLNKGFGFRLGLGCESFKFSQALEEIECILQYKENLFL